MTIRLYKASTHHLMDTQYVHFYPKPWEGSALSKPDKKGMEYVVPEGWTIGDADGEWAVLFDERGNAHRITTYDDKPAVRGYRNTSGLMLKRADRIENKP